MDDFHRFLRLGRASHGNSCTHRFGNPMLASREIGQQMGFPRRRILSAPILPRVTPEKYLSTPHTSRYRPRIELQKE